MTAPGPPRAGGPKPYRLSDAERDEAVSVLADAFAAGRLDAAEFNRRMSLAYQAILATDLDPLFADLVSPRSSRVPAEPVRYRAAAPAGRRRPGRPPILLLLLAMMIMIIAIGHLFPVLIVLAAVVLMRSRQRARTHQMGRCAVRPGVQRLERPVR